jgi:predicted enzyme related to lactoylglutathione lyase
MRRIASLDVIVSDVPTAAAFFRDIVGFPLRVNEPRFAEVDAGGLIVMLSPDALVPTQPARGVILHVVVEDVQQAFDEACRRGAAALMPSTLPTGERSRR